MNILIIGGSSYIGYNLTFGLLNSGFNVRSTFFKNVIDADRFANLKGVYSSVFFDINSHHDQDYYSLVEDIDLVIYLAWVGFPGSNDILIQSTNICYLPLLRFLEFNKVLKLPIIFASSGGAVYGNTNVDVIPDDYPPMPISAYGLSKLNCENALRYYGSKYDFLTFVMRISNPYGGFFSNNVNHGLINVISNNVKNKKLIEIWGDGSIVRDYIYIEDLISLFISIILFCKDSSSFNYVFNVGSGVGYSVSEIITNLRKSVHFDFLFLPELSRHDDVQRVVLDIGNISTLLDWQPQVNVLEWLVVECSNA